MSEWDFRKMCINVEEYEFSLLKKENYWPAIIIGSESGPVAFIKRS